MDETERPERKNLWLAALSGFTASLGVVMLAHTFYQNKGTRDVLKSKFNLAAIGLGTALNTIKASQQNQDSAVHTERLEQEHQSIRKHEPER